MIFDPESGIALSIPLVNIRHILNLAADQGVIDRIQKDILFRTAQSLYFPERTWERIGELACKTIPAPVLEKFLTFAEDGPDLKREDAVRALRYTREVAEELGII